MVTSGWRAEGPSEQTLHRWLDRAVTEGLLCQDGPGRCGAPFRYWLPAREQELRQDALYQLREEDEAVLAKLGVL